jgi:hypothetical protein
MPRPRPATQRKFTKTVIGHARLCLQTNPALSIDSGVSANSDEPRRSPPALSPPNHDLLTTIDVQGMKTLGPFSGFWLGHTGLASLHNDPHKSGWICGDAQYLSKVCGLHVQGRGRHPAKVQSYPGHKPILPMDAFLVNQNAAELFALSHKVIGPLQSQSIGKRSADDLERLDYEQAYPGRPASRHIRDTPGETQSESLATV